MSQQFKYDDGEKVVMEQKRSVKRRRLNPTAHIMERAGGRVLNSGKSEEVG